MPDLDPEPAYGWQTHQYSDRQRWRAWNERRKQHRALLEAQLDNYAPLPLSFGA